MDVPAVVEVLAVLPAPPRAGGRDSLGDSLGDAAKNDEFTPKDDEWQVKTARAPLMMQHFDAVTAVRGRLNQERLDSHTHSPIAAPRPNSRGNAGGWKRPTPITPWRPDGRPVHREYSWVEEEDGEGKGKPVLIKGDQTIFFEARAFGGTLDEFHNFEAGHTNLFLINTPTLGNSRRDQICKNLWGGTGGLWRNISMQDVFETAWARSKRSFELNGTGEGLYAIPTENSCMVLVDDLKTPEPVLEQTFCIILETSQGNYQHLYAADRTLNIQESQHIQRVLVSKFGGDWKATNGKQPHRVPGSVNFKKGRNLFVTRLVGTISKFDKARPLSSAKYLRIDAPIRPTEENNLVDIQNFDDAQIAAPRTSKMINRASLVSANKNSSQSEIDWRDSIKTISQLNALGLQKSEIEMKLIDDLNARGAARGKWKGYGQKTVDNLKRHHHL